MSQSENSLIIPEDIAEWGQAFHDLVAGEIAYSDKQPLILLAHTDDGVLWGQLVGAVLIWSSHEFNQLSPQWQRRVPQIVLLPQRKTLQQLRLFNESGELLIWRDGDQVRSQLCLDNNEDKATIPQTYCLWGDQVVATIGKFKLLQEGERGLWHAPPLNGQDGNEARLTVHHYVDYDEMGQAYIYQSRLVHLEWLSDVEE